jgi:hypothetical protein
MMLKERTNGIGWIIALSAVMLSVQPALGQLEEDPWPMFRHDLRHTGRSEYSTEGNMGDILWSFWTAPSALGLSSPAIDKNGTIYVGWADWFDGGLWAIYPGGTKKWEY